MCLMAPPCAATLLRRGAVRARYIDLVVRQTTSSCASLCTHVALCPCRTGVLAAGRRTDADGSDNVLREALTFLGMMDDDVPSIVEVESIDQHAIRQAQAFNDILQPVQTKVRARLQNRLAEQPHVLRPFEGSCRHSVRTAGSASSSTPFRTIRAAPIITQMRISITLAK